MLQALPSPHVEWSTSGVNRQNLWPLLDQITHFIQINVLTATFELRYTVNRNNQEVETRIVYPRADLVDNLPRLQSIIDSEEVFVFWILSAGVLNIKVTTHRNGPCDLTLFDFSNNLAYFLAQKTAKNGILLTTNDRNAARNEFPMPIYITKRKESPILIAILWVIILLAVALGCFLYIRVTYY